MNVASFFSGAGGLDLGFTNAGFNIVFANDNWSGCWETFEKNHKIDICKKSITEIVPSEIPEVVGFIGGPPCQSWSLAGAMRGIDDERGQLFYNYIELIKEKKPLFFLAENVSGMLSEKHRGEFKKIISKFKEIGYEVSYKLINAKDYGVPQDRERIIVVGYHKNLNKTFVFPEPKVDLIPLKKAISDLPKPKPAKEKNYANLDLEIPNHEYFIGDFSTMYMSRNRVRSWEEPSFTIQAGARHAPIHPQAPKMKFISQNERQFIKGKEQLYRRLSVRECARIQTFPDNFIFYYNNVSDGYKMIGNAVPVKLAEIIANKIRRDLEDINYNTTLDYSLKSWNNKSDKRWDKY